MDLKQYKYLVVCGDSFTQGHVMGEQASWAYWTAEKLGLELINLAIGGMANDWIYSKPILWFNQNKDKIKKSICMVAWTDFGRQHTIYQPVVPTENDERWITNIHPGDLSETPPFDINSTDNIPNALKYMQNSYGSKGINLNEWLNKIINDKEYRFSILQNLRSKAIKPKNSNWKIIQATTKGELIV